MSPQIKFQPDDVQLQAKSKPTPKPKSKSKSDPNGKTRSTQSRIYSFLYHTTFYLFVLLLSILLAGGAAALGEQAWRNVDERKWDVVVISAAYAALVCFTVLFCLVWLSVTSHFGGPCWPSFRLGSGRGSHVRPYHVADVGLDDMFCLADGLVGTRNRGLALSSTFGVDG